VFVCFVCVVCVFRVCVLFVLHGYKRQVTANWIQSGNEQRYNLGLLLVVSCSCRYDEFMTKVKENGTWRQRHKKFVGKTLWIL
jgi:uncharacterized membrane protein